MKVHSLKALAKAPAEASVKAPVEARRAYDGVQEAAQYRATSKGRRVLLVMK